MTTTASLFLSHWMTGDDTPLLAAADSLEEGGDVDRATFIRLSLELERMKGVDPNCRNSKPRDRHYVMPRSGGGVFERMPCVGCWPESDSLRTRLAALKAAHVGECPECGRWAKIMKVSDDPQACAPHCTLQPRSRWDRFSCPKCSGNAKTLAYLAGLRAEPRLCDVCDGSVNLFDWRTPTGSIVAPHSITISRPLHFHRGLILVEETLERAVEEVGIVRESGGNLINDGENVQHPTAWSAALLGARRDCGIWITNREPAVADESHPEGAWIFFDERLGNDPSHLPSWLMALIPPGDDCSVRVFDSPEAAKLALAMAVSRYLHAKV